jgi:hypothetical protein
MRRAVTLVGLLPLLVAAGPASLDRGPSKATPMAAYGPTKAGEGGSTSGPAPSWVSAMMGAWMFDEASGNRINAQGNATLDLPPAGTVSNDTTNKMEGTAAANFTAGKIGIVASTVTLPGPVFSIGCWLRPTGTANGVWEHWFPGGAYLSTTASNLTFAVSAASAVTALPANTYAHIVGTLGPVNQILYKNGQLAQSVAKGAFGAVAGRDLVFSQASNWTGQMDECFFSAAELPAAAICRICSCGIRGEQCICNGTAYASTGRNAANCGSCPLPSACNVPDPALAVTSTTTTTSSTSTTLLGQLPSWVPGMTAVYLLDEASGTRVNAQGTTARNLSEIGGTIPNDTTNKMEGTAAVTLTVSQALQTLDAAIGAPVEPFTCGFWSRKTNSNSVVMLQIGSDHTLMFHNSDTNWSWNLRANNLYFTPGNAANTWTHVGIRQSAGVSQTFKDGVARETSTRAWTQPTGGAIVFAVGSPASGTFVGQVDEVWCTNTALSAASLCRICSCGIRGELCSCTGTAFNVTGRNASACGSCTLPADCTAATPP